MVNSHSNSPQFLDEEAVRPLLKLEALIPAMERALADFSTGCVLQPVRSIVSIPQYHGFMGLMPAVYGDVMGAKLVNLYPDNGARGLPTHLAVIVLFRAETGETLAVMDGRLITELRTAAVSAVATKLLSSPNASSLAILGSGVQARAHFRRCRWCARSTTFASGAATRSMRRPWQTRLARRRCRQRMRCAVPM